MKNVGVFSKYELRTKINENISFLDNSAESSFSSLHRVSVKSQTY